MLKIERQLKKIKEILLKYPNHNPDYIKKVVSAIDEKLLELEQDRILAKTILDDEADADFFKELVS